MTRPIVRIYNAESGIITDREMNDKEIAQNELDNAEWLAKKEAEEAKLAAKQALLEKLGITEEEAKLLLGGN